MVHMALSKQGKSKVAWLPFWPNRNIYVPIFNNLGRMDRSLELFMIVPEQARSYRAGERNFRIEYLPHEEYKKVFFLDYLRRRARNEEIDVTTTMMLRGLVKKLEQESPDVVVSNLEYSIYTLQSAWYCRKHGRKLIIQSETKIVRGFRRVMHWLFMRAILGFFSGQVSAITCWTEASRQFMSREFSGYTKAGFYTLPPGVDTSKFYYKRGRAGRKLRILVVSRFAPYKRHEDILKAAKHLKESSGLDFEVAFLGDGPRKEKVRQQARQMGVDGVVKFLPKATFDEMRQVYSRHDLLVLSSFNEAIGMVVPEAMACGTPVIVSDTSGAATYVDDGRTGFIFRTFDYRDLAAKVKMLGDKKRREAMGLEASREVRKRFSSEVIAASFGEIIRKSLSGRK